MSETDLLEQEEARLQAQEQEQEQEQALALAKASAAALWDDDKTTQSLGMQLESVTPGECTLSMRVTNNMCNGHSTCHGGFLFTLADSAFAFACNSYNQRAVAQHCNISFINPAFANDVLTARACEVSRSGRNGIYDIVITNQDDIMIAQFRGNSRTIKGQLVPI